MNQHQQLGYNIATTQLEREAVNKVITEYLPSPQDLRYGQPQQQPRVKQVSKGGTLRIRREG